MQINRVKLAEWAVQVLAVLFFVLVALDSYEKSTRYLVESVVLNDAQSVGVHITTNTHQVFWHILIYGLWTLTWFLFYFGIYKRYEGSLKKKILGGLAGWITFSAIHMALVFLISKILQSQPATSTFVLNFDIVFELGETIFDIYFIIGVIAFMTQTSMQFLYRYRELEQADHMQSELALIRSQLRPHFFFNTLNNLYSMALETKNDPLADGIQNLTGMMRYSLKHSTKELVPLKEEWEYIKKYVELQKLRIDEKTVDIKMDTKGQLNAAQVAPMILINFVENAFKHGISYEKSSFVHVLLETTDASVILSVHNSNHPSKQETGESGIGTAQTKKLLQLYYEDEFDLNIRSTKEAHTVHLKLPVR